MQYERDSVKAWLMSKPFTLPFVVCDSKTTLLKILPQRECHYETILFLAVKRETSQLNLVYSP